MCTIEGKRIDFDAALFESTDIVSKNRLKNTVLVFGLLPFAVGDTELFCIGFCRTRHDLVAAVGTALFVFGVVVAGCRFNLDKLVYNLLKRLVAETCLFSKMAVCCLRSCSTDKKECKKFPEFGCEESLYGIADRIG